MRLLLLLLLLTFCVGPSTAASVPMNSANFEALYSVYSNEFESREKNFPTGEYYPHPFFQDSDYKSEKSEPAWWQYVCAYTIVFILSFFCMVVCCMQCYCMKAAYTLSLDPECDEEIYGV